MSKNKKTSAKPDKLLDMAEQAGLLLMSAAVTLGMLELPVHPDKRVILPNQPAFAVANERGQSNSNSNMLRRESEETEQHYISYSVAQRTPARSGRS